MGRKESNQTNKQNKYKKDLQIMLSWFKFNVSNINICYSRKTLLVTPPKISKTERRQMFEAQVKAQDELQAEYQREQERIQQEQLMIQQQQQQALLQDPNFMYYALQDPNFLPSVGIDPQQFIQQCKCT